MQRLFRPFASLVAAAAILVVGASSAFAAADPQITSLDANFCYTWGAKTYCYDIDGSLRYLDSSAGSSFTLNKTVRTTVTENGVVTGEAFSTSMSRSVFEADGTAVVQTVTNTRSSLGDEPCTYRLVVRLIDYYDAVVYETESTC